MINLPLESVKASIHFFHECVCFQREGQEERIAACVGVDGEELKEVRVFVIGVMLGEERRVGLSEESYCVAS